MNIDIEYKYQLLMVKELRILGNKLLLHSSTHAQTLKERNIFKVKQYFFPTSVLPQT